jgi:acyl dehydratase
VTPKYSVAAAPAFVGRDLGASDWVTIDQDRTDQFATWTGDPAG